MNTSAKVHWGYWAKARAQTVGFRNQKELAAYVGCRPEQLCRWCQRSDPPRLMSKGFDRLLAVALKVDRQTLFTGYRTCQPDVASTNPSAEDGARRRVLAMVELLSVDGLKELARAGEQLLRNGALLVA